MKLYKFLFVFGLLTFMVACSSDSEEAQSLTKTEIDNVELESRTIGCCQTADILRQVNYYLTIDNNGRPGQSSRSLWDSFRFLITAADDCNGPGFGIDCSQNPLPPGAAGENITYCALNAAIRNYVTNPNQTNLDAATDAFCDHIDALNTPVQSAPFNGQSLADYYNNVQCSAFEETILATSAYSACN